jgi:hypothetical protein
MSRKRWPLAALVLIAVIGAGCSNGAAESGSTGTPSSTPKKATGQDKAVKFAECIRGHGVPHFPDPDAKGDFRFGIDVTPAVWQKAVDACKDLEPPGALSGKRSPKQQSAALRFAQCMREKGVKDFPDPVNGDPLIDTTHIPSSNRPGGMTILNGTIQKCRTVLDEAVGGQG